MNVTGVATVWLPVTDVGRAVSFYTDKLGLTVASQDGDWAEVTANQLTIGLNGTESPAGDGGGVIAFRAEGGIDAAAQELADAGVETGEVSEHPWGRIVSFKDPDGNDLQLYEPPA